ncbi:MAG TPA: hypothetical protein VER17_05470 [Tepidisphaeraceae bacterium]|nr:hypothetical protein [Tepidisphaeraceae bacterium]
MNRFRKVAPAAVLVAVAVICFRAPAARAQVLQQVPADALVVVKFNKLKATSDKWAQMAQKLGVAEGQQGLSDPLGAFKQNAKITNGMDDAGDAAMFVPNLPMQAGARGQQQPPMVLLLPVTDYQAFIANFQDAKTEGGVSTVRFGTNPMDSYVVNWGKYAAISTTRDALAKKPEGIQPQGISAKELNDKDVCAYVNMKAARAKILPALAQARTTAAQQFEQAIQQQQRGAGAGAGADPDAAPGAGAAPANNAAAMRMMPLARAGINRVFDVVQQVVTDADAATYGFSVGDDGLKSTMLADFTQGSPSAQRVAQLKGTNESLVGSLPAAKYIFVAGGLGDPKVGTEMLNNFLAPIEAEAAKLGAEGQAITTYTNSLKAWAGASRGSQVGWVAPTGALGQEAIFQFVSVVTGDAQKLQQAQQQMLSSQQALMDAFSPAGGGMQVKTNYTPNAKTIDGVALSQFQRTFTTPEVQRATPQQMQMQQMMTFMYGPNGVSGYTGAVGNDKLIVASGVSDQVLQQLITAAKGGQGGFEQAAEVQSVKQQLPQNRLAVGYLSLDTLVTTAANYARMFGMPVNLQLPQNLPPIGGAVSTEGGAVRADGYIPAQLVQSLVASVQQMQAQMRGGGGGGGGQQPGGPGGL